MGGGMRFLTRRFMLRAIRLCFSLFIIVTFFVDAVPAGAQNASPVIPGIPLKAVLLVDQGFSVTSGSSTFYESIIYSNR